MGRVEAARLNRGGDDLRARFAQLAQNLSLAEQNMSRIEIINEALSSTLYELAH